MQATPRRRVLGLSTLGATAVLLGALLSGPPAGATPQMSPADAAIRTLEARGLVGPQGASPDVSGIVTPRSGLRVASSASTAVSMRPETARPGRSVAGLSAVTYEGDGFTYVLTGSGTAADAGYSVIADASAPSEFRYEVTVDGVPATLREQDGAILVEGRDGRIVNVIGQAWATDAGGRALPSWYSIEGGSIVQHVEHAGAEYPVVADPRLQCNGVFCTMEYTRSQTQILASWGGTAGGLISAGCSALAGALGAVACGLASGTVSSTASTALSQKKCFGQRAFIYVPIITTHAVVVPCYA